MNDTLKRSQRLFSDWFSTLKSSDKKEVIESLKTQRGVFAYRDVIEMMNEDGDLLRKYYNEVSTYLNEDSKKAKDIFCKKLLESVDKDEKADKEIKSQFFQGGLNDEGYEQYAVLASEEYGNNIPSDVEVTQNGLVTQIIRAIVGGNMAIAAQLTAAGWATLTPGDKMSIFNVAVVQSGYNQNGEKSKVVAKDNGEARFYLKGMKKNVENGSISKADFIDKAFPRTDLKYMRPGNLEKDS